MNEYRTGSSQAKDGLRSLGSGKDTPTPPQSVLSKDLVTAIESRLDRRRFQDQHWTGTFWEYLDLCAQNPAILRNAYQRLHDAIDGSGPPPHASAISCRDRRQLGLGASGLLRIRRGRASCAPMSRRS